MHQFLKFILLWNNTLRILDVLSVHRQEFKTVHTATGICQTDTATCCNLLATSGNKVELHGVPPCSCCTSCCMYSLELLMMDGRTIQNM
jgi:hypothetical protein